MQMIQVGMLNVHINSMREESHNSYVRIHKTGHFNKITDYSLDNDEGYLNSKKVVICCPSHNCFLELVPNAVGNSCLFKERSASGMPEVIEVYAQYTHTYHGQKVEISVREEYQDTVREALQFFA